MATMEKDKKPDAVVFNVDTDQYDASLKSYATSLGSPKIISNDTVDWKNRSINKLNHKIQARYEELKKEYEKMMVEFEYNRIIFNSKFAFEPIVGEIYHLYKRKNGETFLSLIAPEHCNFDPAGSFYLNTEQIWEKHESGKTF